MYVAGAPRRGGKISRPSPSLPFPFLSCEDPPCIGAAAAVAAAAAAGDRGPASSVLSVTGVTLGKSRVGSYPELVKAEGNTPPPESRMISWAGFGEGTVHVNVAGEGRKEDHGGEVGRGDRRVVQNEGRLRRRLAAERTSPGNASFHSSPLPFFSFLSRWRGGAGAESHRRVAQHRRRRRERTFWAPATSRPLDSWEPSVTRYTSHTL
ncbi:hypothetical protein LX32DRAFT_261056 [Colletotrichum zoysiae]|uniref:Uncharacterized protein n=1 Tax=Colletotrichum zoysiae TaxID=1216348 RepID=A0AAD9LWZ3_9PEZI|nr:hypothetical protein LX32DRAFT_261056 [Colletotrichum zoysiae]